jgi:hypothetical protein
MPDKVNEFYEAGRELYLKQMDTVITRVADIVGTDLNAAKSRIAAGKSEIAAYVKSLPAGLQKLGAEASQEINDKFEQLEDDVKSKQDSVVDTLASKYVEARKGLDDRIEELQAENKGLVDKAIGAIKAVINTIRKLAAMLMDTLSRVAHVVGDIIKHPVRFLGNLVEGIKGGIIRFKDNILTHLRKGLMTWLFGALAEGGVELPDKFDLQGIIQLLASLFGLTWRNIRNRLVKQIGEPAMAAIEKGVEVFKLLASGGIGALWQMLMEKLGDIKEMILEQVKDFVITKIITAGITWLIGLLNPAAAFIKACKLIYDIIMFFVNNAERILKFVNTVIDSAVDIVRGNIGGVVAKIEESLGQLVPILIGFLASAIGIGGIGQKIREIIEKLQKPVNKAIDFVIKTGLKLAGPIIRGLKGISGKVKAKVAAGKAWVKGKAEAGKEWVKGKAAAITGSSKPAEKEKAAILDADRVLRASKSHGDAERQLTLLRRRYSMPLKLVVESRDPHGESVHVQAISTASHLFPPGSEEGDGMTTEASASAFESTAAETSADYLNNFANWRRPRRGQEMGQVRARPVHLSQHAVEANRAAVERFATASPASAAQKAAAIAYANARIAAAAASQEEASVYRYLRQAASRIQDLYGGRDLFGLDVEHLTEVAQNKETFVRTRISRKYGQVVERVRTNRAQPGTPEREIADLQIPMARKREIARLYAEQIVEESLGDVGESVEGEGSQEIELLIITTEAHAAVTARRARQRRSR